MAGKVKAGSPWMRTALAAFTAEHPGVLAVIEDGIPDGSHIAIFCGRDPRPLGATLVTDGREAVRVEPVHQSVGAACLAVLFAAEQVAA